MSTERDTTHDVWMYAAIVLFVLLLGGFIAFLVKSTGWSFENIDWRATGTLVLTLISGLVGFALYFVPTAIALNRDHHQVGPIVVVNILLGWTFVGWVVALAMSVSAIYDKGRQR